jgi:hypothetical protein
MLIKWAFPPFFYYFVFWVDYTKWQREYFDSKTPEEISAEASRFEAAQPFVSEAVRL